MVALTRQPTPCKHALILAQTWSLEQLANRDPSALSETLRTQSLCPDSVLMQYLPPRPGIGQIKNGCIVTSRHPSRRSPPTAATDTQDLPRNNPNQTEQKEQTKKNKTSQK
jgi:hypothetical protein